MKLADTIQRASQHAILHGDPKTGKSVLASKLAESYKLIWISLDNGHTILYKLSPAAQANIELIALPDTKEYPIAIETCMKIISGMKQRICNMHGKVNCPRCPIADVSLYTEVCMNDAGLDTIFVFDHISQLAVSAMNHITKAGGDDYRPDWDDYRKQGTLMDKFLGNIQQSKNHVLCIAHCTETEMEDGKKKLVPLVGTVPFSRNAGKYFDHVVHCDVKNKRHAFGSATTYAPLVLTGSRSDVAIESATTDNKEPSLMLFFNSASNQSTTANSEARASLLSSKEAITK